MATHNKVLSSAALIIVACGLWYVFRPELLFINKKVDEPAPGQPATALYTGKFQDDRHRTSGRATVYRESSGNYSLALTNLSISTEPALHVLVVDRSGVVDGGKITLVQGKYLDLGQLKPRRSNQIYSLPAAFAVDPFNTVVIYSASSGASVGAAKLEAL